MSENPKITDKYPSLVISGYIYSVRREPLTEDEGNIKVRGLRSPRRKGFFVKNERLPMYNFPLIQYIY